MAEQDLSPLEKLAFSVAEEVLGEGGVACVVVASHRLPPPKFLRLADAPGAIGMKNANENGVGTCVAYSFGKTATEDEKKQVEDAIRKVFPDASFMWQFVEVGARAKPDPKLTN